MKGSVSKSIEWLTLWVTIIFLSIDALVLMSSLIRMNCLLKRQPEIHQNEKFIALHVVVLFLLIVSASLTNLCYLKHAFVPAYLSYFILVSLSHSIMTFIMFF